MNPVPRAISVAALLLLSGVTLGATSSVDIVDFNFAPQTVVVNLGDSVRWVNKGTFPHQPARTEVPFIWTSPILTSGKAFTRDFTTAGTYTYKCAIHPSMTGTVIVRTAENSRINIGNSIVQTVLPITLNLTGKQASQVYLGSYIVNAQSGCANCHSCPTYAPGHNPYLGQAKRFNATTYLAGGVGFAGGAVVSANLTPVNGRPAGLGLGQFKELLRTGHDPDVPGALLPVMPWPIFGMMTDADLNAVYVYLSAVPPATTPAQSCGLGQ